MNKKIVRTVVLCVALLLVAITAFSSFATVQSGHVGVVTRMGAVQEGVLNEGLHFITPFVANVIQISVRTAKAEVESTAASRDLQMITANVAVNYSIIKESAATLFKTVGLNFEAVVIMPAIQESVKSVTAQFSAEELITKRQEVSANIKSELAEKLTAYGFMIEALNITGLDFSEEFNKAIEAKQTAQQQALKAEQDLNRIRIEAQQQVEQAKAQAQATRETADAQAYAISKLQEQLAMSEKYIEYETIQRWDGRLPVVVGENGNILDISSILNAAKTAAPSASENQ